MTFNQQLLCVTGLPRAGSTLLCQLLGMHPAIDSSGHSSPLLPALGQLRHHLSDNPFLLAQLDVDFPQAYGRLLSAFRGFMQGWFAETTKPVVVDKNRGWLNQLDLAVLLEPQCRMLVCVRELGQIIGSIEAQHQQTLLLDFPDHLASQSRYGRANKLMGDSGVVGEPLQAIAAMQDMPPALQQRVYYVVFEHLLHDPVAVMGDIFQWVGVEPLPIDPQQLPVKPHESDSHYRYKYRHTTQSRLQPVQQHKIPARIQQELYTHFDWFYATFYPGLTVTRSL